MKLRIGDYYPENIHFTGKLVVNGVAIEVSRRECYCDQCQPPNYFEMVSEKVENLPPNFVFSPDDPFYYPPVVCNLLHYRTAAAVGSLIEFALLLMGLSALYSYRENMSTTVPIGWCALFVFSTLAGIILIFGIYKENPKFLIPKIAVLQLQIVVLLCAASVAVISMCFGIEVTDSLFGIFVKVPEMERDFGPIWPFNVTIICFFAAAIGVWLNIIVRGAYDFFLDKEFFTVMPNIEMKAGHKQ